MEEMKEAALSYAAKGWPVFPCRRNKAPYTKNGVLDATTNIQKINQWWDMHPRANIGLDVGSAGMVVLDLDPGHTWREIIDTLGLVPDTGLVQSTPRGGKHLFFTKTEDEIIPPSNSEIIPFVDVKSFHSYVLLNPSVTEDGNYLWEQEGKPSFRPDKLVELATAKKERSENYDTWLIDADLPENIEKATEYCQDEARIAIEGQGGDTMAYKTAAMMKSFGLSPATAFEVMWDCWNPRCEPPWSLEEADHLEQKILNAYAYNTSPPGNLTSAYKEASLQALFKPIQQKTDTGGKITTAGRFRAADRQSINDIKPPEWLIKDAIPKNSYAMLIGPRSTYKTFIALDMALSIASGANQEWNEWSGVWQDIPNKGPVLFAAGEGRSSFKQRIEAWEDYHTEGEPVKDFILMDPVPFPNEQDINSFINLALEYYDYYEFVVIDTAGRAMRGMNENSQQDASLFNGMIDAIIRELRCSVLVIHHSGHEAKERARGSSVFGADIDVEFVVKKHNKNIVHIRNTKQKDAPEWDNVKLVHLKEHAKSLVAVTPNKSIQQQVADDEYDKNGDKRGKLPVEMTIIRKAAYQAMKSAPGKEWSKTALANAISYDDSVSVGASILRQRYLDQLLTDKAHPVARCFDPAKGKYIYRK